MTEFRRVQQALDTNLKIVQALRAHQAPEGSFDYSVQFFAGTATVPGRRFGKTVR